MEMEGLLSWLGGLGLLFTGAGLLGWPAGAGRGASGKRGPVDWKGASLASMHTREDPALKAAPSMSARSAARLPVVAPAGQAVRARDAAFEV
jgi:hypothetical protein